MIVVVGVESEKKKRICTEMEMGEPRRAEGVELLNGVGVGAGSGSQEVLVSGTRVLKMRCRFDAAVPIPV